MLFINPLQTFSGILVYSCKVIVCASFVPLVFTKGVVSSKDNGFICMICLNVSFTRVVMLTAVLHATGWEGRRGEVAILSSQSPHASATRPFWEERRGEERAAMKGRQRKTGASRWGRGRVLVVELCVRMCGNGRGLKLWYPSGRCLSSWRCARGRSVRWRRWVGVKGGKEGFVMDEEETATRRELIAVVCSSKGRGFGQRNIYEGFRFLTHKWLSGYTSSRERGSSKPSWQLEHHVVGKHSLLYSHSFTINCLCLWTLFLCTFQHVIKDENITIVSFLRVLEEGIISAFFFAIFPCEII